jgi:hypothetical protein
MHSISRKSALVLCPVVASLALAACGGGGDGSEDKALQTTVSATPVVPQVATGLEDSPLQGMLSTKDLPAGSYQFEVTAPPEHGTVQVDPATGEFSYTPHPDYFGTDAFNYRITKTARQPVRGRVVIDLANVNDAPVLGAIDDMMNSAETRETSFNLPATDIDSEELQVTVIADDPTIASVSGDGASRSIQIAPEARGTTKIRVSVSDGQYTASQEFDFSVGDVTKSRTIAADMTEGDSVLLTNNSDTAVVFTIEHNGFPQFQSKAEMVQYVMEMIPIRADEPFEHKLWRFVRDNMYHNVPLNADQWLYDPWAAINSQGWGFCGHAAAVYVLLAREAGYEARVWGLNGHVVPEISVQGEWQVYDPDLAIYYYANDGKVAGIDELASDSSLISSPITPLFAPTAFPYSLTVANIYGSAENNFLGDNTFLAEAEAEFRPVTLPPQATLIYPGAWSTAVLGVDGSVSYAVPHFLQSMLTVPQTHTGAVSMPWMLWEMRGSGTVRVDGTNYLVGSPELIEYIQRPGHQISNVEVVSATSPIEFIFFINAMRYTLDPINQVNVKGKDVWAVAVNSAQLPEDVRVDPSLPAQVKKPAP